MKIKKLVGLGFAGLLLAGTAYVCSGHGQALAQVPVPLMDTTLTTGAGGGAGGGACDLTREMISVLRLPIPGSPVSWQVAYGDEGHYTEFGGAVALPTHTVATFAGRVDPKTMKAIDTGVIELNRRGRAVAEKFYPAKNDEHVVGVARLDERYVGVSNMRVGQDRHVRVSFYEADGTFKNAQSISDALYDLEALQVINAVDGNGFVVVMQAVARKDKGDQSAMLMRFDAAGKQLWKRSFRPGTSNKIAGLSATDDKGYIASGGIMMSDGRMAGWALKLSYDGTILWQQTYPRGKYAMLNAAVVSARQTADGVHYYAFTGVSTPGDNGPDAAWIMETDPFGTLLWQRYLRRADFRFEGIGLKAQKDGRLVVALNGTNQGAEPAHKDHARLVTFSPRGVIINDETVLSGVGSRAQLLSQTPSGDFVLSGASQQARKPLEELYGPQKPLPEGQQPAELPPYTTGWVAVMPTLGAYADPCGPLAK